MKVALLTLRRDRVGYTRSRTDSAAGRRCGSRRETRPIVERTVSAFTSGAQQPASLA